MIAWLFAAMLVAGPNGPKSDTTVTLVTPSDGVIRVALRSALAGRDTGVTIEVKNSGDSARHVVLRCEPLHGARVADSLLLAQPETLLVPARTSAATRLSLPAALATLPPGVYLGGVVASAGKATVRRQLVVTVDRLPALMLIGSTWTVRVVRSFPGVDQFHTDRSALLPVPADADTALLGSRADSVGTALAGPMGAIAYAYRRGPIERLAPGVLGVPLDFEHLTTAGDYTGPLTLVPGLTDSKLTLTVRVTDYWLWPAAAIALGILLAFALQRYTSVDRKYWQLKADILRAAGGWAGAQQQYEKTLMSHAKYQLGPSYLKECDALLGAAKALAQPLLAPLDTTNDAYKAAQQRLATLQSCLTDWPRFATDLNALAAAIQRAESEWAHLKTSSDQKPDALGAARDVLIGKPLTVAGFAGARTAVTSMTVFLGDWTHYAKRVGEDRARIVALASHVDPKNQTLDSAHGYVAKAGSDLLHAISVEDLKRLDIQKSLDTAEGLLAKLEDTVRVPSTKRVLAPLLYEGPVAPPPLEQAEQYQERIGAADALFLFMTLTVAVLTGFKTLYLGQNTFGTASDYISAILWGFGTKYTLDTVVTVAGRFFQRAS